MAGRKAWEPTKKQLATIKELTSRGATNTEIYTALNIGPSTWRKYRLTPSKNNDKNNKNNESIKKAINDGLEDRLERIKNNCIDSLDLMTRQHVVKEVKRTRRKVLGQDGDDSTILDTATTRKVIEPNPTVVMFTSVNLMPERFQSINKVEVKQENKNEGGIKMELID